MTIVFNRLFDKEIEDFFNKRINHSFLELEVKKYVEDSSFPSFSLEKTIFLKDIVSSEGLFFISDYHHSPFPLKILQQMIQQCLLRKKNIVIGLEYFHLKYQKYIDLYLADNITIEELLKLTHFLETWPNLELCYIKSFLSFLKENSATIIAINSDGTLEERDQSIVKTIYQTFNQYPNYSFFVFLGEFHLLPQKIPSRIDVPHKVFYTSLEQINIQVRGPTYKQGTYQLGKNYYFINMLPRWVYLVFYLNAEYKNISDILKRGLEELLSIRKSNLKKKEIEDYAKNIFDITAKIITEH